MITQPTDVPSGNNTKVSGSTTEPLVPDVTQSHISNQAFTSSHHAPQDRWSRDQHIKLVNIIGNLGKGMLTRSMAAKLTVASASECLFANFLSEIEPKKVSEALKHPGWIDAMQEELNQFYKNKEEGIDYDETFAPVVRMEAIRIFLAFATYMNFKFYQMDVKMKTPMVPPNNLGPDLAGKLVNETSYRGMIGSLMLELVPLSLLVSGDVILSTVRSSTKHNLVSPSCDFVILYEHVVMNLVIQLESGTFTTIFKYPALK
ncbi:retrovirus-related pol polyprotein from transposon TNT 1-94 [Tanacetum coccineum]